MNSKKKEERTEQLNHWRKAVGFWPNVFFCAHETTAGPEGDELITWPTSGKGVQFSHNAERLERTCIYLLVFIPNRNRQIFSST